MNKVLVELLVPEIEQTYSIFIPASKKISTIISLLSKAAQELSDGYFEVKKNNIILDEFGNPYNLNDNVKTAGIKNGTKIILI